MAEQEHETTQVEGDATVAEDHEADELVPRKVQRRTIYVVEEEFTHKRKQPVGSIFRPRRYPRLRPLRLRELIAGGFIRPATDEEVAAFKQQPKTRINPVSSMYVPEEGESDEVETGIEELGGGWYEVTGPDGEVHKVQGQEAAEQLLEELNGEE